MSNSNFSNNSNIRHCANNNSNSDRINNSNSNSNNSANKKVGLKCYLLQLAVVLLLAGYQLGWGQWQIETNILSLLPTDSQAQASQKHNIQQA